MGFYFEPVFVKENISEVAVDDIDRYGYLFFFLFESFDLTGNAFTFFIGVVYCFTGFLFVVIFLQI